MKESKCLIRIGSCEEIQVFDRSCEERYSYILPMGITLLNFLALSRTPMITEPVALLAALRKSFADGVRNQSMDLDECYLTKKLFF